MSLFLYLSRVSLGRYLKMSPEVGSSEKRHKEGGVYRWELIATAQYVGDP